MWFETLTITSGGHGIAALSSEIADQAALHGTLNKIRDLNLLLISVTCLKLDH
jgi:hypothetical protein